MSSSDPTKPAKQQPTETDGQAPSPPSPQPTPARQRVPIFSNPEDPAPCPGGATPRSRREPPEGYW